MPVQKSKRSSLHKVDESNTRQPRIKKRKEKGRKKVKPSRKTKRKKTSEAPTRRETHTTNDSADKIHEEKPSPCFGSPEPKKIRKKSSSRERKRLENLKQLEVIRNYIKPNQKKSSKPTPSSKAEPRPEAGSRSEATPRLEAATGPEATPVPEAAFKSSSEDTGKESADREESKKDVKDKPTTKENLDDLVKSEDQVKTEDPKQPFDLKLSDYDESQNKADAFILKMNGILDELQETREDTDDCATIASDLEESEALQTSRLIDEIMEIKLASDIFAKKGERKDFFKYLGKKLALSNGKIIKTSRDLEENSNASFCIIREKDYRVRVFLHKKATEDVKISFTIDKRGLS